MSRRVVELLRKHQNNECSVDVSEFFAGTSLDERFETLSRGEIDRLSEESSEEKERLSAD